MGGFKGKESMKPDLNRISPPVSSTRRGTMKIHQLCNVFKEQLQN